MASGSGPAGTVSVEVVADLSRLEAGLDRARTTSKAAGTQIADDLGRIETGAKSAGAAVERLAGSQDGVAQSTARVATASEQAIVRWQRMAAQADAYTRAAKAAAQAQAAINAATGVRSGADAAGRAADIAAYGAELDRLRAKFNPLFAAGQAYKAQLTEIAQAAKVGAISEAERAAAVTRTKEAFTRQVEAIRSTTGAVAISAHQWQNLGFQINDVFTSLSSGASPLMVLAQQGGQIYQALDGPKGVTGGLKEVGNFLMALATPARLAIGGLIGLFAAAALAADRYLTQQNEVEKSLLGVGRASGATAKQIEEIAEANAAAGNVSVATAKEVAAAFAATGKIQVAAFAPGIRAIRDYAAATRQEIPAATEQLAKSLANLADGGFEEIAKATNSFDAASSNMIRTMIRENDILGAISLTLRTLDRDLEGSAARVEKYGSGWGRLGRTISDAVTAAGDVIANGVDKIFTNDPVEQLARQIRTKKFVGIDTSEQEKKLADLRKAMAETDAKAGETAQRARDNAKITADSAVRAALPQVKALEDIRKEAEKANAAKNAREAQGDTSSQEYLNIKTSLEALTKARRDYEFAADKGGLGAYKRSEQIAAEAAALAAKTPADRAAAAADKERADQIGLVIPRAERYQRINEASNKVLREHAQASADSSRVMNEETSAANAVANALTRNGDSVARLRAEKEIERGITAGTIDAADRETKVRELLAKQYAEQSRGLAETVRKNRCVSACNFDPLMRGIGVQF